MGQHRLFKLPAAKGRVGDAVGHQIPFLYRVFEPKLHGIHPEFLGQFINDCLDGQGGLRLAWGSVALHFLSVADDIVAIDEHVVDFVRAKSGQRATAHWRAWKRAGFKGQIEMAGRDFAIFGRADFGAHMGGRGRSGALKHLLTIHHDLDRPAAFFRQNGGHWVEVGDGLAAESTADFHRHHLDLGLGNPEDRSG